VVDLDLAVLADRPGWSVEENVAIYRPVPGGWHARVTQLEHPNRASDRHHVALISPVGAAVFVGYTSTIGEARRIGEGWVAGKTA
jgi:acetyltransferase-like isoleucine patch superfamily enzyme